MDFFFLSNFQLNEQNNYTQNNKQTNNILLDIVIIANYHMCSRQISAHLKNNGSFWTLSHCAHYNHHQKTE